jgi:hypothetical protein
MKRVQIIQFFVWRLIQKVVVCLQWYTYKIKWAADQDKFYLFAFFAFQKQTKHDTNKGIKASSFKGKFHNCRSQKDSSSYVTEEEEKEDLAAYKAFKNQVLLEITGIWF